MHFSVPLGIVLAGVLGNCGGVRFKLLRGLGEELGVGVGLMFWGGIGLALPCWFCAFAEGMRCVVGQGW